MDPSIKDPWVKLTLKSWGFYLNMPHDSLVRVIIFVMALIAVVLTVPRVNWSLMVVIGMLTIIRVIKVIVTLALVMMSVPTRNWSLRIPMVVIECPLSLDCLICKVSMDSILPERLFI